MNQLYKKKVYILKITSLFLLLLIIPVLNVSIITKPAHGIENENEIIEHQTDKYFRLLDEDNELLWETGRPLHKGEQFLTPENKLYEITEVNRKELTAHAEYKETVELPATRPNEIVQMYSEIHQIEAVLPGADRGSIAMYFTHNAESYVPSDGTESIEGKGGIHKVGEAFKNELEKRGITVYISEELHLPHNRGAYRRSRETVESLLANDPDAIFDIHRNAAPEEAYAASINGEQIAQIMITVGRQNPHFELNKEYALSLKNAADELHEGLIRGVFFGQGDYNQDLSPLNLLLEVGGHMNTREDAEQGIRFFADAVDYYFFAQEGEQRAGKGPIGGDRTAVVIALELIGLTLFAAAALFIINAGSFEKARERFKKLVDRIKGKVK